MATSTIKNYGKISGTLTFTTSSKVTIMTKSFRYSKLGVAELNVQFHLTEQASNGEELFTILGIYAPDHTVTVPMVSSSDRTKYGNVSLSSGGVITAGGTLPAGDWYALHMAYMY